MEEKELNALLAKVDEKVKDGVKAEMKTASEGLLTADQFGERMSELGIDKETIANLTKSIEDQGIETRKLMEEKNKSQIKSINQVLKEKQELIKSIGGDNKGRKVTFFVPKANVGTGDISSDPVNFNIPGFADTAIAPNTIEEAWRSLGIVQAIPADSHGTISYTDLSTRTNIAAATAEEGVYPENTYAWTGYTRTIEKVIGSIPVTWEALTDIPQMEATIRRLIAADIKTKVEAELWDGDGSAPNVYGLYTAAQTAAPTGTSATTTNATIFDLAMWMKNYIVENYGSKFMPNVVILNNTDALKAKWVKADDGQYVSNPFASPDMTTIDGMRVVASPEVTAGTMLVGDMRYATLYMSDGVEIEVGLDGNDFTYDLYTIKARQRLCTVIRSVDAYGFLKSTDIDTDIGHITSVSA